MKHAIAFFSVFSLLMITSSLCPAAQTSQAENTLDANAPYEELLQVTPSNSTVYNPPLRGCIVEAVGGGTDLVITTIKGSSVTLTVAAGQEIRAMITVVGASTTATVMCGR